MAKRLWPSMPAFAASAPCCSSLEGEQLGCVQQEWTHKEDPLATRQHGFRLGHNWDLARGCIRGVIEQPASTTSPPFLPPACARGIVLYDKDGQEIWACANVDARASDDEVAQLRAYVNPELEKQIYPRVRPRPTRWVLCPACSGVKKQNAGSLTKRLPPCAPCSTTGSFAR